MSLERYFPPRVPGTTQHMQMERGAKGKFCRADQAMEKIRQLKARIKVLEALLDEKETVTDSTVTPEQAHQNWLNTPGG